MERHWGSLELSWWLDENTSRDLSVVEGERVELKSGDYAVAQPCVYWFEDASEASSFAEVWGVR